MPARALRISSVQDDLITVLSAEDPELLRFARRPRRTYYDLKRRIQRMALERGKTDIAIRFRRGERTVALRAAERDPELMAPIPWSTRKFLRFRPVPIDLRRECSW